MPSQQPAEVRLSSERAFDGRLIKVDVDRVRCHDGLETIREVVRHPGAVLVVPLLDGGRVAMVRQFRYGVGGELLELPAGTLEPGEEPLHCAQRELAEETGLQAGSWRQLGSIYTTPGFTDELIHIFLATEISPAPPTAGDADELIVVEQLPLSAAQAMARGGQLRDSKTICALLMLTAT